MLKMIHLRIFRRSSGFFLPKPICRIANHLTCSQRWKIGRSLTWPAATCDQWGERSRVEQAHCTPGAVKPYRDSHWIGGRQNLLLPWHFSQHHFLKIKAFDFVRSGFILRCCSCVEMNLLFFFLIWFPILEPISIASKTVDNTTGTILPENHVPGSSRLVNKQANGIRWSVAIAHRRIWSLTGALQELPQSFIFGC